MTFHIDAELTVWREVGQHFVARFHKSGVFYSGDGATAFEAIAWTLDDYVRRAFLGQGPSPVRNTDARPGDGLADAKPERARRITPAPIATDGTDDTPSAGKDGQCFEERIPRRPAPRLFGDTATTSPTTRSRKRRASGGRR